MFLTSAAILFSENQYQYAIDVLTKYNTRVNPRDYEVTSNHIFIEILSGLEIPMGEIEQVKFHFYTFFRQDVSIFPEVEETLKKLSSKGILLGTEPWNENWTIHTATKRLHQMINTEDSYGLCAYQDDILCGAILGCMEQFYNGIMFNVKEFWVKNGMRGQGVGTQIFS